MPCYEYHCEQCGQFEKVQRITEAALEKCPTCDNLVKRLISTSAFSLKGTGWAKDGYQKGPKSTFCK